MVSNAEERKRTSNHDEMPECGEAYGGKVANGQPTQVSRELDQRPRFFGLCTMRQYPSSMIWARSKIGSRTKNVKNLEPRKGRKPSHPRAIGYLGSTNSICLSHKSGSEAVHDKAME
jgi:hypothetical protein